MAEPQPSAVTEGIEDSEAPKTAEEVKTASALNALESRTGQQEDDQHKTLKQVDPAALGDAIKRLEMSESNADKSVSKSSVSASNTISPQQSAYRRKQEEEQRERERRSKIKVDQAEVTIICSELDLSKTQATELLRAHEGKFDDAVRAYVRMAV